METYTIHLENRDYTAWNTVPSIALPDTFHPWKYKMFHEDQFTYNDGQLTVTHSPIKEWAFPAVLILEGNKTYGRCSTGKHSKLLYRCLPNQRQCPAFLVPYEMRQVGFGKAFDNKYVLVHFHSWNGKHPEGRIEQVFGDVSDPRAFYEYQLHCHHIVRGVRTVPAVSKSISFTKAVHEALSRKTLPKVWTFQEREPASIFTIDPPNSHELDDAFSISLREDDTYCLSIYIANVPYYLEAFNLWSAWDVTPVASIYQPNMRTPMLPCKLSEQCSLIAGEERAVFCLDLHIRHGAILSAKVANAIVKVSANFTYDEPALLQHSDYQLAADVLRGMGHTIETSSDVVEQLMIHMNRHCAEQLAQDPERGGLFRRTTLQPLQSETEELRSLFGEWSQSVGEYHLTSGKHEGLQTDAYVHITSPIRRAVDVFTMFAFQKNIQGVPFSPEAGQLYHKWTSRLNEINQHMKNIRKVQTKSALLHMLMRCPERTYRGYVHKQEYTEDKNIFKYTVFLPECRLVTTVKLCHPVTLSTWHSCKIVVFADEVQLHRKIRVALLD